MCLQHGCACVQHRLLTRSVCPTVIADTKRCVLGPIKDVEMNLEAVELDKAVAFLVFQLPDELAQCLEGLGFRV